MEVGDGVVAPAPPRALTLILSRQAGEGTDISRIDGACPLCPSDISPASGGNPELKERLRNGRFGSACWGA